MSEGKKGSQSCIELSISTAMPIDDDVRAYRIKLIFQNFTWLAIALITSIRVLKVEHFAKKNFVPTT